MAPLSKQYWMVGKTAWTRARLVNLVRPILSKGTLKSTRMDTLHTLALHVRINQLKLMAALRGRAGTSIGQGGHARQNLTLKKLQTGSCVDTWDTLSSVLYTLQAVAVSPPAMTVVKVKDSTFSKKELQRQGKKYKQQAGQSSVWVTLLAHSVWG